MGADGAGLHRAAAAPTVAVLDAQSVETSRCVAERDQGIDAGKKIKGRKRHLATDTLRPPPGRDCDSGLGA